MSAVRAFGAPAREAQQPGSIRAVFLALLVHAGFFTLIVFGVTWQSRMEAPVMAELWDKLPTPRVAEPPPPPPPKVTEEKIEPPKPPEEALPDPQAAKKLAREKREKEKRDKLEREKAEKEKRARDDAAKQKREEEKRRVEDERARREAEKAREAAAAARKVEFDRFVNQIRDKIRGRANVPDTVTGNPEVHVRIRILPGGEVLDISITKRSGNPTYDTAIERAIRSASPLPVPPANSELFPQFRDLNLNIRHER